MLTVTPQLVFPLEDLLQETDARFSLLPNADNQHTDIPHPIPYQGSKRALAGRILACFPLEMCWRRF